VHWLIGLAGSSLIAGAAYARRSLSGSGAAAAVVTGTLMFGFGSLPWYGLLLYFFLSSTLWSKTKRSAKLEAESGYEKSGRRDAGQVAANGGLAAALCAGAFFWPHEAWWTAFLGVMGTVTADTWATELGGLSRTPPRSIRTGRRVAPGVSGGVTLLGLAAAAAGALSIGGLGVLLAWADGQPYALAWIAAAGAGGFLGALADSWIGAAWQRMNRCTVCGKEVESGRHCGAETRYARGLRSLNNDAVNAISSAVGGLAALVIVGVMQL
jgi:uncharacterized protein (TIGR00297 family)